MTGLKQKFSGGDPIERIAPWSRARRSAAFAIRTIGFLLGAALACGYLFLMWIAPPDFSHARPGTVLGMWIGLPLLLLFGPFWLADWLAGRLDNRRVTD
jgi:hypothetical protein